MKRFDWNESKNIVLQKLRKVSFEDVVAAIKNEKLIEVVDHPNKEKYPNQKIFIVEIYDYIHIVPIVEDEEKYFLKTIYPSREATKRYLNR